MVVLLKGFTMKNSVKISALFAVSFALSGCQTELMSNERMSNAIAGTLGVPASNVTLSDRRTVSPTNTDVVATLSDGKRFACALNGGGLLAMGIINPPTCNPAQ
jgi:hypothetical protein